MWLFKFNASKCVVLKIRESLNYLYTLNGKYLDNVTEQKDLGIIISNNLHPRKHIIDVTKKANQRIEMIKRCFTDLTEKKVGILYKTIIRPVLEYGTPVWSPWQQKDIQLIEKVQNRCMKLCNSDLTLDSLEKRRHYTLIYVRLINLCIGGIRQTLIKMLSIQKGNSGDTMKIAKQHCKTDVRKNFFSYRVVDPRNHLPEETV